MLNKLQLLNRGDVQLNNQLTYTSTRHRFPEIFRCLLNERRKEFRLFPFRKAIREIESRRRNEGELQDDKRLHFRDSFENMGAKGL